MHRLKAEFSLLWFVAFVTALSPGCAQEWPPLNQFSFSIIDNSNKTLNGCDTTQCSVESGGEISEIDVFGDIAVYAGRQGGVGGCFISADYCTSGYLVEEGEINGGIDNFTAYKIHPASNPAGEFIASHTQLMFRIDSPMDGEYIVYKFVPSSPFLFVFVGTFVPIDGEFVMTDVDISELTEAEIFLTVHQNDTNSFSNQKTTIFQQNVDSQTQINLLAELFDISPAKAFQPATGWNVGPDDHLHKYGFRKVYSRVQNQGGGKEGVVWQDQEDWTIYLTWFTAQGHYSTALMNPGSHYLVAASDDGGVNGEIIYVTVGREEAGDGVTPLDVFGYKVDSNGTLLMNQAYDTSKDGLDVYKYSPSGSSLYWDTKTNDVGWMFSRTMTRSDEGLNQQSCICIILDGTNLTITSNMGQTSSHSWNNYIGLYGDVLDDNGELKTEFLAVDLGDNFPRGINVHKISATAKQNKIVYQFKTKHGTSAQAPSGATYPEYQQISNENTTFYQWSNDNAVYTEIAQPPAHIRSDGSIMIIFSGERPSLDNSYAVDDLNAPRNLGVVIVSPFLDAIVSEGESSKGGYFDFGGTWHHQLNEGIIWLTDLTPDTLDENEWENAVRIKTAPLKDDKILIFYEVWSPSTYIRTDMMIINTEGAIIFGSSPMSYPLRLSPSDEPTVTEEGDIVFFGMDETDEKLVRFYFQEKEISTSAPTFKTTQLPTLPPTSGPTIFNGPTSDSYAPTRAPNLILNPAPSLPSVVSPTLTAPTIQVDLNSSEDETAVNDSFFKGLLGFLALCSL